MDFPLFPFDTFLNGEKVSIFLKKHFRSIWESTPSHGRLFVYAEIKQGWATNWGTAFDLAGVLCHLPYPVWLGIAYRRKNEERMEPLLIPSLGDCYLSN